MKSRNFLVLFVLALMFTAPAFAQKGLEVGVRIIPQSVWIINDDDAARGDGLDYTRTWGMAYGVQAGYNFLDFLGLQTGLLVSSQGQKYVHDGSAGFETSQVKLNYLKIPILLKVNSSPDAGAQFVATAGVQMGILTNAKYYTDDEEVNITGLLGNDISYKDLFSSGDLAAVFSLGARFRVSDSFNLGLSFRGDYSLSDIENKEFQIAGIKYYPEDRAKSANLTGGIMIEANYILGSR